jgi:hypothetical protein
MSKNICQISNYTRQVRNNCRQISAYIAKIAHSWPLPEETSRSLAAPLIFLLDLGNRLAKIRADRRFVL